MDGANVKKQIQISTAKTVFWAGVFLCICFVLSMAGDFREVSRSEIDSKLNPNTASVYELSQLPSIGPAKAMAMEDYRRGKKKAFETPDDIEKVKGIGRKTVEKIKPWLKFND